MRMSDNVPKRILIIGDSISIGYTPFVAEMLKGKATVQRPDANCGSTILGLEQIDSYLGNEKWDLIHFNWGLHDIRRMDSEGNFTPNNQGNRQVSTTEYRKNLVELVTRLRKTGASLIWCSTTPVPDVCDFRVSGDEVIYNNIALDVMSGFHIKVDDLHAAILPRLHDFQNPRDVHFNEQGSRYLAEFVVKSILSVIQAEAK